MSVEVQVLPSTAIFISAQNKKKHLDSVPLKKWIRNKQTDEGNFYFNYLSPFVALEFFVDFIFFLLGCPCVCLADSAGCLASCFLCCYCPVAFSISIPFPCLKKKTKENTRV